MEDSEAANQGVYSILLAENVQRALSLALS